LNLNISLSTKKSPNLYSYSHSDSNLPVPQDCTSFFCGCSLHPSCHCLQTLHTINLLVPYKPGTSTCKLQVKTRNRVCTHVPCSTGLCLPIKVGSGAAMCPVAPDPAFLIGRAPTPPRVPWLWTPPPYNEVLRCTTYPTTPDPAFLHGRAPVRHVSCSSRSCLPVGESSGAPRILRLRILPPYREGSGAVTA
jgi:hypothetical protein